MLSRFTSADAASRPRSSRASRSSSSKEQPAHSPTARGSVDFRLHLLRRSVVDASAPSLGPLLKAVAHSSTVSKSVDNYLECGGVLPPGRVVQVVAGELRRPVVQDLHEPPCLNV